MTEPTTARDRGSWMQTFTGRQFFPLDPRAEDVDPRDIAHALSLICRYGGHTRRFYSVAEHCWLLSYAVAPEHALAALLHDATEAYVGDMVRPLKHGLPQYQQIEWLVWGAITYRFGLREWAYLPPLLPAEVKDADNRILLDERDELLTEPPAAWGQDDLEPLGVTVQGWSPEIAEWRYMTRLRELVAPGHWSWPHRQQRRLCSHRNPRNRGMTCALPPDHVDDGSDHQMSEHGPTWPSTREDRP